MAKNYATQDEEAGRVVSIGRWDDVHNVDRFCAGDCQILFYRSDLLADESAQMRKQWPEGSIQPETFVLGWVRVAVVVNRGNAARQITHDHIRDLLKVEGKGTRWADMGGLGGVVKCYGEGRDSTSRLVIRRAVMMLGPKHPTGYHLYREDFEQCQDADEVIKKIRADRNGIGFVLYRGQPLPGVKILAVSPSEKEAAVHLKEGKFIQEDYPLSDSLALYLRPDAPELAGHFCKYAISDKGAKIAGSHGLVTPRQHAESVANERFSQVKAGRGIRLSVLGIGDGRPSFVDLATEYVRAKAVVQLFYKPIYEDLPAIGDFVGGGAGMRELLFLADKPSARAMAAHGEKWKALGSASLTTSGGDPASPNDGYVAASKPGQPAGTGPAEHLLAGRAVAVIVNPANKLSSLSLGQLRDIFGGKVKDWNAIGSTGLTAGAGAGLGASGDGKSQIKKCQIKAYGLRTDDPATAVFEKECLSRYKWGRVVAKKDTAAAVAAVSMDPQAIAYVDLMAIPGLTPASLAGSFAAAGQNVKVLAIKPLSQAAPVLPTPANIKIGTYALSQRLYVYVHPKASATARDFVKFIATCGASEATPYADTVKSVMASYNKYSLIPLAPAAIQRITKEAKAVAAKAKAAAEAAKPKRKPKPKPAPKAKVPPASKAAPAAKAH